MGAIHKKGGSIVMGGVDPSRHHEIYDECCEFCINQP